MSRVGILITVLLLSCFTSTQAQFFKKRKAQKLALKSDSLSIQVVDLNFPNIHKMSFYFDKKKLKQIEKLEKAEDWEKLFPILRDYVNNFGVENFALQTYMIWRLAKLTETFASKEAAKPYYQLVLKHHRKGLNMAAIMAHYDSLDRNKRQYFVPLEYYYELVEFRKQVDTLRPPRGVLLSMGRLVNSREEDYAPIIAASNDMLLFTSKRNSFNDGLTVNINEDIFITRKTQRWNEAESLDAINTRYNEGSAYLSRDGKTLYFARCDSPDGLGNCDIFQSTYVGDSTWGEIENLGKNINTSSWDSHPTLSPTEDTLYFASDRPEGFGLSDIYYSVKQSNGKWSKAKNAGPVINTRANEVSPFFHPQFNVLYFSSNGHLLNFGDYDIYKSNFVDNRWSEPVNIGPLVNGKSTEFYFSIDKESQYIFYSRSSKESMKNLDLFSFPLPMAGQPEATTRFSGSLVDENGNPMKGIVSVIDLDEGVEVAPKFLREDGTFDFDLINERNYLLVIQGDDYFRIEELFFLDGDTEYEGETERVSSKIKFTSVEFENGKAEILPNMEADLVKVVNFLLDNPDFNLNVSGHTDSSGNADFNLKLSQQRADAIKDYIVFKGGVSSDRITATGFGSSKPIIVDEQTAEDRKINRRVEFEIYRDDSKYEELIKLLEGFDKNGNGN